MLFSWLLIMELRFSKTSKPLSVGLHDLDVWCVSVFVILNILLPLLKSKLYKSRSGPVYFYFIFPSVVPRIWICNDVSQKGWVCYWVSNRNQNYNWEPGSSSSRKQFQLPTGFSCTWWYPSAHFSTVNNTHWSPVKAMARSAHTDKVWESYWKTWLL